MSVKEFSIGEAILGLAVTAGACMALGVGVGTLNTMHAYDDREPQIVVVEAVPEGYLPPCEYEDSTGCYWDASERGNGEGNDFVNR